MKCTYATSSICTLIPSEIPEGKPFIVYEWNPGSYSIPKGAICIRQGRLINDFKNPEFGSYWKLDKEPFDFEVKIRFLNEGKQCT